MADKNRPLHILKYLWDTTDEENPATIVDILNQLEKQVIHTNKYIDKDMPLLIWATMSMKESFPGNSWYFEDGTEFTWIAGEHCLVLVGYDDEYYFLNDPMSGSTVGYQKTIVEKRFAEFTRL